jgi:AcrR family transcriptional regulator
VTSPPEPAVAPPAVDPAERGALTRERIVEAAEALLRRHGPAKTTVVDVARALGMSHANIYRHFASKAALRDAVAERWLHSISAPLAAVAAGTGPAPARLEAWVLALAAAKRRKVLDDPELFATYHALAEAARGVVEAHVAELRGQLAAIVRAGVGAGEFAPADPDAAAAAVFDATARFHHPHLVREAAGLDSAAEERALRRVVALLAAGLRAGA